MKFDLVSMEDGTGGIVSSLDGGEFFSEKMGNMGIVPGAAIKKITGHFMRGPVIVKVKDTEIAIGYGMSKKIIVEVQ
ncbi:MAG: ferrous iron transport protein A [Elusimicrobia bacterium CG03_land_8_20_14_0_80_50_18]|nr:MAG: ferrous iron transport protein A [Elusimicrobia bacterium CG03_land_8_20_14_0_80_50_18]PIX15194.1 MAG: ferrous iron transport protein A [Elusimicrobia bacterium CG_4_8_14_3_um_filter_50_9]